MADCRATEYRTTADGYEAFIEDRWLTVPADRVLDHTDNPTGRAIVCYTPARGIMCFIKGPET